MKVDYAIGMCWKFAMQETLGDVWKLTFEPSERKRRVDCGDTRVELETGEGKKKRNATNLEIL